MPTNTQIIEGAIASIREPDIACREAARGLQSRLTKPSGALGRLETLHIWAAGVLRDPTPELPRKMIIVAAADHGVAAEGVSAYPPDVTAQMVRNFLAGGAAINAFASQAGARLRIVDAGVAVDMADDRLVVAKVRRGTESMTRGPAMTRDDAKAMLALGIATAGDVCAEGATVIGLGDMGIGNTTAAAAVTSVLTHTPPAITAGRGTGIDDARFAAKVDAIARAIDVNQPDALEPIDILTKVGGLEIAFLAGVALGTASSGAIVIIDGYPTTAAALIADALAPAARDYMLASHLGAEPGHRVALDHLGLQPLLDLGLRLGEGTGAALAMPILDAALRLPREMATFEGARVSRSSIEVPPEA